MNNKSDWLLYLLFNRSILCRSMDRRHDCNIFMANTLQRYVRTICGLVQFGREMPIILSSLWPPYGHQICVKHRPRWHCKSEITIDCECYLRTARAATVGLFVCLEHKMAEIFAVLWSYWKMLLLWVFVFLRDFSLPLRCKWSLHFPGMVHCEFSQWVVESKRVFRIFTLWYPEVTRWYPEVGQWP